MMKKYLVLVVAMLLVASVAYAGIVGSKHDMRSYVSGEGTTQVCVFCHVPHNAVTTSTAPLWNHTDTSTASFGVYTSATISGATSQPAGVSRACLSCHDGTVAVNSLVQAPSDGNAGTLRTLTGTALVGTDLSNDHPVSITYRNDLDSGLRAPTGTTVVNGAVTAQLYGTASPYTVECASCHLVHDPTNTPFLRVANTNSQLCTACHLK
jgi:predicted CXXCH cytochrome family protein